MLREVSSARLSRVFQAPGKKFIFYSKPMAGGFNLRNKTMGYTL